MSSGNPAVAGPSTAPAPTQSSTTPSPSAQTKDASTAPLAPPINTDPAQLSKPQSSPSAPSISLTPATPENAASDKMTQPAPIAATATASAPAPAQTSSSVSASTPAPAASAAAPSPSPAATASSAPAPAPAAAAPKPKPGNTAQPAASASSSKPAARAQSAAPTKHKRKRTGLNRFLAAFGCLSASEIEDDPREVARREKAEAAQRKEKAAAATAAGAAGVGAGVGAAVAAGKTATKEKEKEERKEDKRQVETSGTGGTTLADVSDKKKDEVVVSPSEPVSPPVEETAGVTSAAVQPPGSGSDLLQTTPSRGSIPRRDSDLQAQGQAPTAVSSAYEDHDEHESDHDGHDDEDDGHEYEMQDEYEEEDRLIAQGGLGIPVDEYGNPAPLLPAIDKVHVGRKCLVLDLDETLLHSSFKMLPSADYIVPVEIESQVHNVYVIKRPGVDRFLEEMGKIYEVVVFTASLSKYADPVLDMLDVNRVVRHRLFRESCYNHKGNYVKDLSQLGRTMETSIIIDNSPASYIFHPNNAVPVSTWFNDPHDTELTDLCPFLTDLATVDDVRGVLDGSL